MRNGGGQGEMHSNVAAVSDERWAASLNENTGQPTFAAVAWSRCSRKNTLQTLVEYSFLCILWRERAVA